MILIIHWKVYGVSISSSLSTEKSLSKIGSCLMSTTVRAGGLNAGANAFKDQSGEKAGSILNFSEKILMRL